MKRIILAIKIIILFFLVIVIIGQIRTITSLSGKKQLVLDRQTLLSELKIENQMLKKREAESKKPEFIEREARNKLGMGKIGETLVLLPSDASSQSANSPSTKWGNTAHWKRWVELFFW